MSSTDLVRRLGDVLSRVRYLGDTFTIERNGDPVARLAPLPDASPTTVREAFAALGGGGRAGIGVRGCAGAGDRGGPAAGRLVGLVVDTSAFVAIERSQLGLDEALSAVGNEAAALPAMVYAELLAGVRLADTAARAAARRAKIDALAKRVPVVPFGPGTAERWAEIFAALQRAGTAIPAHDGGRPDGSRAGFRCAGRPSR